jgi:ATP-dependent metalloprotease FtsH
LFSSGGSPTPRKTPVRNWVFLGIVVLLNLMLVSFLLSPSSPAAKDYSAFQTDVNAGNVTTIVNSNSTLTVTLKNGDNYTTVSDTPQDGEWATIEGWLKAANVDPKTWPSYANEPPSDNGWILTLITFLVPMLFLGFIIYYFMRSAQGVNNAALGFGKSRAKMFLQGGKTSVTFADVAGVDEAKAELQEVVEFLKYPEKFSSLGARIPRGVLVVGPPGSGKTLIAKAVANEAGVPFFSISGSEFVEMFVGVGASVSGDTPIMVRSSAGLELLPIAEFVDRHYQAGKSGRAVTVSGVETLGYAPPAGQSYEGLLADGGTCAWVGVRAVLRHPVSEIYEIAYAGGILRATADHSVFVRSPNGLAVSPTRFLRPGDRLVLAHTVETCALGSPEELRSLATQAQKLSVSAAWEKILGAADGSLASCTTSDPVVLSVNKLPYDGYVYDLVGCDNEAFFGGQSPVLLHNSRVRDLFDQAKRNAPCLTGDTLITMADGSRLSIGEMYDRQLVGQQVLSMTEQMGVAAATIVGITRRPCPDLYAIATNHSLVRATGDHLFPLLTTGQIDWRPAKELRVGSIVAYPSDTDPLIGSGGVSGTRVLSVRQIAPVDFVFDLVLDQCHNFIANDLFVHNCVIFVDEIDAVGRQRGTGLGGSHDEREQTLNQILVEMDGFDSGTNVIVIAATNRPDVLDPALLRPGRFDRQVILDRPDLRGRIAILRIHLKGKPIAKAVDVESLGRQTPGFSGADLANLTNEAAILAARHNKKAIEMTDFSEAIERVSVGPQRASRIISDAEKRIIAIHEGGHAVVQRILPKCDPVHKVTIISRGMALGYTSALPTEDRYLQSKSEFEDKIAGLLAGHAAERLMFGDTTTGASNDIEKATTLARKMVTEWGMSDKLGPLVFGRKDEAIFLGRELGEQRNYSDEIAYLIDEEVGALIKGGYARATEVLTDNKMRLMRLADKLIAEETVEGAEFEALFADLPPKEPIHAMNPTILSPDAEMTDGGSTPVA